MAVFSAIRGCKPGSVLTAIYLALPLPAKSSHLFGTAGQAKCPVHGVAPDRVYSMKRIGALDPCFHGLGALLPHLFTLTLQKAGRYLSVALVLGSPPAGVTRYPCPVEPGLSSSGSFRFPSAAVRPGRGSIVTDKMPIVKYLANSFPAGYTIVRNPLEEKSNWNLAGRARSQCVTVLSVVRSAPAPLETVSGAHRF